MRFVLRKDNASRPKPPQPPLLVRVVSLVNACLRRSGLSPQGFTLAEDDGYSCIYRFYPFRKDPSYNPFMLIYRRSATGEGLLKFYLPFQGKIDAWGDRSIKGREAEIAEDIYNKILQDLRLWWSASGFKDERKQDQPPANATDILQEVEEVFRDAERRCSELTGANVEFLVKWWLVSGGISVLANTTRIDIPFAVRIYGGNTLVTFPRLHFSVTYFPGNEATPPWWHLEVEDKAKTTDERDLIVAKKEKTYEGKLMKPNKAVLADFLAQSVAELAERRKLDGQPTDTWGIEIFWRGVYDSLSDALENLALAYTLSWERLGWLGISTVAGKERTAKREIGTKGKDFSLAYEVRCGPPNKQELLFSIVVNITAKKTPPPDEAYKLGYVEAYVRQPDKKTHLVLFQEDGGGAEIKEWGEAYALGRKWGVYIADALLLKQPQLASKIKTALQTAG